MIQVKDLMFGNIINRKFYNPNPTNPSWELEKCEIVGVRKNSVIVRIKGGSHLVLDYWEGVPLTEEILLNNCKGFSIIESTTSKLPERKIILHSHYMFNLSSFYLTIKQNKTVSNLNHISLICNNNFIHHINYVHEWQNWFKLITKEELEINF